MPAPKPKLPSLADICRTAADEWYRLQCESLYLRLYAFYLTTDPAELPPGYVISAELPQIQVAAEPPSPLWRYVRPDPISPALSAEQAGRIIYESARRVPCLPPSYALNS